MHVLHTSSSISLCQCLRCRVILPEVEHPWKSTCLLQFRQIFVKLLPFLNYQYILTGAMERKRKELKGINEVSIKSLLLILDFFQKYLVLFLFPSIYDHLRLPWVFSLLIIVTLLVLFIPILLKQNLFLSTQIQKDKHSIYSLISGY